MSFDNFDDDRDEFEDDFNDGRDDYLQDDERSSGPGDPYLNQPFRNESSGMSTGMKILLGVLGFGFLCFCICCGGVLYFSWNIQKNFQATDDPAEIEVIRKEFLDIDIPADYTAKNGFKAGAFGISGKMVMYQGKGVGDSLVLMHGEGGPMNEKDFKFEMNEQDQQGGPDEPEIEILEEEEREFTIDGKQVTFKFSKAKDKDSGKEFRRITGAFTSDGGFNTIIFTASEENWDEAAAVKMIESIKPVKK